MNEDFLDFLRALLGKRARFLIVGAHALAVHGVPRATGDLDVWIDTSPDNAAKVWLALLTFGAPVEGLGVDQGDLERPNQVIQIGLPPRRIDLLTTISGVDFEAAWSTRTVHSVSGLDIPFLGYDEFIANKRAAGRAKDLADLEELSSGEDS